MDSIKDQGANTGIKEFRKEEFPSVLDAAIVKPKDEKPMKMQLWPEENLEEGESNIESWIRPSRIRTTSVHQTGPPSRPTSIVHEYTTEIRLLLLEKLLFGGAPLEQ